MVFSFTLELDKLAVPPASRVAWKTFSTSLLDISGLGLVSVLPSITFASHSVFQRLAFLRKCAVLLLKAILKGLNQTEICYSA